MTLPILTLNFFACAVNICGKYSPYFVFSAILHDAIKLSHEIKSETKNNFEKMCSEKFRLW